MPSDASSTAVQHPSPHRGRAALGAVAFGLLAAPAAWALDHVATYSVASVACYPGHVPRESAAGLDWVTPLLFALYVTGLVVALAGAVAARRVWSRTQEEAHGAAGHAVEIGEGRTRFMALWGMMTSGVFVLLMAFDTISLLMVPLCDH